MRLGGPNLPAHADPEGWAAAVRAAGYRAAYCPVGPEADDATVAAYARAAQRADVVIAEVGAWSNPLSADRETRGAAREKCTRSLDLAERIGVTRKTINTIENVDTQAESSNQSINSSSEQSNAPGNQTESQQNSEAKSSQKNKSDAVQANQVSFNDQGSASSQNSYAASQAALSATNALNNSNNLDSSENLDLDGIVEFHPEAAALELEMFQEQLDNIAEQIEEQNDEQTQTEEIRVGVVTGFTGAVSFGYGLWILRGGSLLASMASSLPILSSIDPLPILENWQSSSIRKQRLKSDLSPSDEAEMKIGSLLK